MRITSPFYLLRYILNKEMLINRQEQVTFYILLKTLEYDEIVETENEETISIYDSINPENESFSIKKGQDHLIPIFDIIESEFLDEIYSKIYLLKDDDRQHYLNTTIQDLQSLINTAKRLLIKINDQNDLKDIIFRLEDQSLQFQDLKSNFTKTFSNEHKKILWLGSTKVLATLFFELLNGQLIKDKGKKIFKPPIIKVPNNSPSFLINFITNNFLSSDGKPIKPETLSTYFKHKRKRAGQDACFIFPMISDW